MDQQVEDNFWLHQIKKHGGEDKWSSRFPSANRVHGGVNMHGFAGSSAMSK